MPLVSVIIPTFNRAGLIGDTLKSVLDQTFIDREVIVVDDGSTDETPRIMDRFVGRVLYVRQENAGQGAARNRGIDLAKGQFLAFLDSDDLWLPAKLERQVAVLNAHPEAGWCYTDVECFDTRNGQALEKYSELYSGLSEGWVGPRLLLEGNFIASPSVLMRREVLRQVGKFDESPLMRCREDWGLWLQVAARSPIALVPEVLARYREHPTNATRHEALERVRKSNLLAIRNAVAFAPEIYAILQGRGEARQYLNSGASYAMRGEFSQARKLFATAIKKDPTFRHAWAWFFLTFLGKAGIAAKEYFFPLPQRVRMLDRR